MTTQAQNEAAALKEAKGYIQRAIQTGHYDPEIGAPLPEVYKLLKQALGCTTCDQFAEVCGRAKIALDTAGDIEVVDGFEMNDAARFTALAFALIFGSDPDEEGGAE